MQKTALLVAALSVAAAACNMSPPRPWLRAELDGPTSLTQRAPGSLVGRLFDADVQVDLYRDDTFLRVVAHNRGNAPLLFRVGQDAGESRGIIGQVLLRRIDTTVPGGPDMQGYAALQPQSVDPGWGATFFLDQPIGREPKLGQYFVLAIEAEDSSGRRERHLVKLITKQDGSRPGGAR